MSGDPAGRPRRLTGTLSVRAPLAWLGPGRVVPDAAVVCDGDLVSYAGPASGAPPADSLLALDGFLMPAIADRHVHVGLIEAGALLASGVTAVRDLGWPADEIFPLADASEGPSFNGPLIRASGPILTAPGGYPTREGWAPQGTGLQIKSVEDAGDAVNALADRGAAQLKVALNSDAGPTPSDAVLAAICQASHDRGLPVAAHVQGDGQSERALGAGIDELAHTPWTERLSDRVIEAMVKTMRWVSTLDILSYGRDTVQVRTALDNARRFVAAGGRISYGTDMGNGPASGVNVRELLLLVEAGLAPEAVLEAATRAPLTPGAPADMIGLEANPFEDLAAFEALLLVVRSGNVVSAVDAG